MGCLSASRRSATRPSRTARCFSKAARLVRLQESAPELLLHDPVPDLSTWQGLRDATNTALHRGKLDRYLWWSYASTARQRLRSFGRAPASGAGARDATEVVMACAKARVESHTGIYSAWMRAVLRHSRTSAWSSQLGFVCSSAATLSRAQLWSQEAQEEFWLTAFPHLITERIDHGAVVSAAAAFALAAPLGDAWGTVKEEVFEILESQLLEQPALLSAHDTALFLWAVRRVGRGSAELCRKMWQNLEGRLSELSPRLLCSLAHHVDDGSGAVQLLRSLSRRKGSESLLCEAAGSFATRGLISAADLWPVVEVVGPKVPQIVATARADLLKAALLLEITDEALLLALQQPNGPEEETQEEPFGSLLPSVPELGPIGEPSASVRSALLQLESQALLPGLADGRRSVGSVGAESLRSLRSLLSASLPSSWAARTLWACTRLDLQVELKPLVVHCESCRFLEACDAEELLRLLPVLPALDAVAASLVVTVAAAVAAAVREQKLSPQQGAHGLLSLSLLSASSGEVWDALEDRELSTASRMELCLAALLEAVNRGDEPIDVTRLQRLLQKTRHLSGANLLLLQLLEAIFSKRCVAWPTVAVPKKVVSIEERPPSWLIAAKASRRTEAWFMLLLKKPGSARCGAPVTLSSKTSAVLNTARQRLEAMLLDKSHPGAQRRARGS